MLPKKKDLTVIGSSAPDLPVPTRMEDEMAAGGGGGRDHDLPRCSGDRSQASGIARIRDDGPRPVGSKDRVVPLMGSVVISRGGRATSKTPSPAPAPRSSQSVCEEQRRNIDDPKHPHGKSPNHHSRDAQGQHARQEAGGSSRSCKTVTELLLTQLRV